MTDNTVLRDLDPTCHGKPTPSAWRPRCRATTCPAARSTPPPNLAPSALARRMTGPASAASSMAPRLARWRCWASMNSPSAAGRCRTRAEPGRPLSGLSRPRTSHSPNGPGCRGVRSIETQRRRRSTHRSASPPPTQTPCDYSGFSFSPGENLLNWGKL